MYSKRVISVLLSYGHHHCRTSGTKLTSPCCRRYSAPAAGLKLKRDGLSPLELIAAQLDGGADGIVPINSVPSAISTVEDEMAALYPYLAQTLPPLWDSEMIENTRQPEVVQKADDLAEEPMSEKEKFNGTIVAEVAATLKSSTFDQAFNSWWIRSHDDRTIAGAGLLMDAALDGAVLVQRRMIRILDSIIKIRSPADGYAECVMALIRRGDFQDAKVLMTFFVLQPRKFKTLVRDFVESNDLISLELFGKLISETYLDDRRAAKKLMTAEEKLAPTMPPKFDYGNVKYLIDVTVKPRPHKIGYRPRAPKVKRYELNAHQMDVLASTMINSWITLAERRQDTDALRRLYAWMIDHHYELSNRQARRLEAYFRKMETPNFFARLSADMAIAHSTS